ncbi:hypothetical protein TNCV_4597471 [Trichonephila clavipes]|nr:hypothetical protein TNCV_4597471 [Trichonephila clavipes]
MSFLVFLYNVKCKHEVQLNQVRYFFCRSLTSGRSRLSVMVMVCVLSLEPLKTQLCGEADEHEICQGSISSRSSGVKVRRAGCLFRCRLRHLAIGSKNYEVRLNVVQR